MWTVTGTALRSTTEFTYSVEAPADAREMDVITSACQQHGMLFRAGTVSDVMDIRTLTATPVN